MNRIADRRALFDETRALAADPARLQAIQASQASQSPPPPAVVQFLGSLELLTGVPFNYLVADEGLLPVESIRFFQVDPNWIYALIEGAASIGSSTSNDHAHDAVTRPQLHSASTRAARAVRARRSLSGPDAAEAVEVDFSKPTSGFLLRSAVVSGWPGLEVTAWDAQGNLLPVIRMDRLSPTILLFWAEGVVAKVNIHEPPEGMHFGVEILGGKILRYVTLPANAPHGAVPGSEIEGSSEPITQRPSGAIKIGALAATLQAGLQNYTANNNSDGKPRPFTSAEFALQMIEAAQSVNFINPTGGGR